VLSESAAKHNARLAEQTRSSTTRVRFDFVRERQCQLFYEIIIRYSPIRITTNYVTYVVCITRTRTPRANILINFVRGGTIVEIADSKTGKVLTGHADPSKIRER